MAACPWESDAGSTSHVAYSCHHCLIVMRQALKAGEFSRLLEDTILRGLTTGGSHRVVVEAFCGTLAIQVFCVAVQQRAVTELSVRSPHLAASILQWYAYRFYIGYCWSQVWHAANQHQFAWRQSTVPPQVVWPPSLCCASSTSASLARFPSWAQRRSHSQTARCRSALSLRTNLYRPILLQDTTRVTFCLASIKASSSCD